MSDKSNLIPKHQACIHGHYGYCPMGCFQTELELAIAEMMKSGGKAPDTEEGVERILRYKQSLAREQTGELSQTLEEILRLEERLAEIRKNHRKS